MRDHWRFLNEYVVPAPAGFFAAPAPMIGYAAFEPAVTDTAPAPANVYVSPALAVSFAAPAPVVGHAASERAVTDTAPAPVNENVAPAPAISLLSSVRRWSLLSPTRLRLQ